MSEWTVRKPARELKVGDRFVFSQEMGGEDEPVTVDSAITYYGTTYVGTEETDFSISLLDTQWVTLLPEEGSEP